MPRHALYWSLQIVGWGILFLVNVPYLMAAVKLPLASVVVTMGLCSLSGLLLTHVWHQHMRRKHYFEMRLPERVRRYAAGVLLLGFLMAMIAGEWYRLFLFPDTWRRTNWMPSALIFWSVAIGIWTVLYGTAGSMRRASVMEKERLTAEVLAKEARLEGLRKQLNPHFLFNSLNSLRALIFEDAQKASQMVDRLAALLRYSLQAGSNEMVTLKEELVMVNEYLSIEKIRFEERLRVEISSGAASDEALLPRMLLQTLVENAVKHGIERSVSGGVITVAATIESGRLHILVRNPGTLAAVSSSTRLGLKNAEQRLTLLVGTEASLTIRQLDAVVEASAVVPQ